MPVPKKRLPCSRNDVFLCKVLELVMKFIPLDTSRMPKLPEPLKGHIYFLDQQGIADVDLFDFGRDYCNLIIRSPDDANDHFLLRNTVYLNEAKTVYSSYFARPYANLDTEVWLTLKAQSLSYDPGHRIYRIEGEWIDDPEHDDAVCYPFYGLLQPKSDIEHH